MIYPEKRVSEVVHLASNALYTKEMDPDSLLIHAAEFAGNIGYGDAPVGGVIIADPRSDNYGRQYIPGQHTYDAHDHLRGLTNIIADSRQSDAIMPAFLIMKLADVASVGPLGVPTGYSEPVMSTRQAHKTILGELNALRHRTGWTGVEEHATQLSHIDYILRHEWHTRRRKVAAGLLAFGAAAGMAAGYRCISREPTD